MKRIVAVLVCLFIVGQASSAIALSRETKIGRWRASILTTLANEPAEVAYTPPFSTAAPNLNSIFNQRWYVRVADFAVVYTSPNLEAPIKYIVGDGFILSTLLSRQTIDDEEWYQINHGEWVEGENIMYLEPSTFQGVEVLREEEHAFGWITHDDTPYANWAGGDWVARLSRYTFVNIWAVEQDKNGWDWYLIGDNRWVHEQYVNVVEKTPRPEEVGGDEYWVEVDLDNQTFVAYEGDRMVYATLISSGLEEAPTRIGLFQVWDRWEETKMSGQEDKIDYYFIEDVPHTQYFDYGIALHGAYWHDNFGTPQSHGCVNMPIRDSEWIFEWSSTAPNPLWVLVHDARLSENDFEG